MSEQQQEGKRRGQQHHWTYDYLGNGKVIIRRDGEPLHIAEDLEKALAWLDKQLKRREQKA